MNRLTFLYMVAVAAFAVRADALKVGFSHVDITPPLGSYIPTAIG